MRTDGPVVIALDGTDAQREHARVGDRRGGAPARRRRADAGRRQPVDVDASGARYPVIDTPGRRGGGQGVPVPARAPRGGPPPGLDISIDVRHGSVVPELRELSADAQLRRRRSRRPSARGRTGVLGAHLAAHARCPVAVVRHDPDGPTPPEAPIVVGVDGSPASLEAARVAAREAWMRGRALVVVHARPPVPDPFGEGGARRLTTSTTARAWRRVRVQTCAGQREPGARRPPRARRRRPGGRAGQARAAARRCSWSGRAASAASAGCCWAR